MVLVVEKSENLSGRFEVPPAKSHGWRILFLTGLADGRSRIVRPKESNDWHEAVAGMRLFGASYAKEGDAWAVEGAGGRFRTPDDVLRCGNSGPLLRYFGVIAAAVSDRYTVITGDESLRHNRLAQPVVDAVNQLGGWAVTTKGDTHAPIVVKGKIDGGKCTVDGAESQIVSALLIGCSLCEKDTEILVDNVGEKPWVEMTLHWLKKAGIRIDNIEGKYDHYRVYGGQTIAPLGEVTVPADWQSAPVPLLAGLLIPGSRIEVPNLDPDDVCPDKLVVDALKKMGANIELKGGVAVASYSFGLRGIRVDANDFTDQFIIVAIAAAFAEGETVIYNNAIQRHKECDRIKAVADGLRAMGAKVKETEDGMIVTGNGGRNLKGAAIDCRKDHRMVMSFAVAGMRADGKTVLSDAESVTKTFSDFDARLAALGAKARME